MTDPVVSEEMMERAIGPALPPTWTRAFEIYHAQRRAYVAGVVDGFVQGMGAAIAGEGIAGDGAP
jgi:hypothetical protein